MTWASYYTSRLYRIIALQKRIVRILMRLPYNSHTGQAFAQLTILKVPQITLMQIGEFMHRYTYNTLPDAFDNYLNRASIFHSYHTRNSTQYRILASLPLKLQAHPFAIVSVMIFRESQVDLYLTFRLPSYLL